MNLLEFEVCHSLVSTDKVGVIKELVQTLANRDKIRSEDFEIIVEAILKREELGSTAIGSGIAIPHAKHHVISEIIGIIGVSSQEIDFGDIQSLVDHNVNLIVLVLAPSNNSGEYLKCLATLSVMMRDLSFRESLKLAKNEEDMKNLFVQKCSN